MTIHRWKKTMEGRRERERNIYIYKYLAYNFVRFPVRFSRSRQDHPLNNNYEIRRRREISEDFEMTLKIIKKKNRRLDAIALRSRIQRSSIERDRKSLDLINEMNRNLEITFSKKTKRAHNHLLENDLSRTIS